MHARFTTTTGPRAGPGWGPPFSADSRFPGSQPCKCILFVTFCNISKRPCLGANGVERRNRLLLQSNSSKSWKTGLILGVSLQNLTLFLQSGGCPRAVNCYGGAPGGAGLGPPFFGRFPFSWSPAMQIDSICNIL